MPGAVGAPDATGDGGLHFQGGGPRRGGDHRGGGGAAHLAGVAAAHTVLPVLGVPMQSPALQGMDSLLSTVQMPAGIPVGALAIGKPGAINAALLGIAILANSRPSLRDKLRQYRNEQAQKILKETLP